MKSIRDLFATLRLDPSNVYDSFASPVTLRIYETMNRPFSLYLLYGPWALLIDHTVAIILTLR